MEGTPKEQFLQARECLALAEKDLENAEKANDNETDELRVARTGVKYARRELQDAREAFALATKADLVRADARFAALVRRADEARIAADAATRLFRQIRDVYHAANAARPAGFAERSVRDVALEGGGQAYSRIVGRIFRLHGEALASVKADLEALHRLAIDCEGEVADALAHAAEAL